MDEGIQSGEFYIENVEDSSLLLGSWLGGLCQFIHSFETEKLEVLFNEAITIFYFLFQTNMRSITSELERLFKSLHSSVFIICINNRRFYMDEQRVAIITGGASGIGKALAIQLANKDIFVIIADINETSGQELVNNIKNNNQLARFEYLDVTNAESVEELIIKIVNEFGRIDYMFNNAGIAMYGEVFDMSLDNWKHIIEINLLGVIYGTQLAYQFMKNKDLVISLILRLQQV